MPTGTYDWLTTYDVVTLPISIQDYVIHTKSDEHRFMGVLADDDPTYACGDCWPLTQRSQLVTALKTALEMIEFELGFSLALAAHEDARHHYEYNVQLDHGMLYSLGVYAVANIATGIVVDYAADPAVISFDTTCALADIEIMYPASDLYSGETIRIEPKTAKKIGNTVTITVPWGRLVKLSVMGDTCVDYEETDNYTATVDAQCKTIVCTTPLTIVWNTSTVTPCVPCGTVEQLGCATITDARLGLIRPQTATWDGAAFSSSSASYCNKPDFVDVSYIEGLYPLPRIMKQALIRLAHTLMPSEPCGCQIMQAMWSEDRGEAPVLAKEQCPWGMMAGAWFAWNSLMRFRIGDGGMITGGYC